MDETELLNLFGLQRELDKKISSLTRLQIDENQNLLNNKTKYFLNQTICSEGNAFNITSNFIHLRGSKIIPQVDIHGNKVHSTILFAILFEQIFKEKLLTFSANEYVKFEGIIIAISLDRLHLLDKMPRYDVLVQLTSIEKAKAPKDGCFIATAVFEDYNAPQVIILRQFRDNRLLTNLFGRLFVKTYYIISPYIASLLSKSDTLKKITRIIIIKLLLKRLKK